jgi:hypothetical protein
LSKIKPGPFEWITWGIFTEYVLNDLFLTHEGEYTEGDVAAIAGWAASTSWMFAGIHIASKIGVGSIMWALTAFYLGKWTSQWLDPEQGKENYYGFITGGIAGNDPNYGSAQRAGSGGYFDIAGHLATIILYEKPSPEPYWSERADTWVSSEAEADAVLMRQLQQSATSGSFTTPEALYQYGFIDTDEYVRRITARRAKASDDAWAKKRKAAAKKKWNALTTEEQRGLVEMKRQMEMQFSAMRW